MNPPIINASLKSTCPFHCGVIHYHCNYSHDGRSRIPDIASALRLRGIEFCVLTDHFEDFDEVKFNRYIEELYEFNNTHEFIFIPGVEAEVNVYHLMLFPVKDYASVKHMVESHDFNQPYMIKFLAHPRSYSILDLHAILSSGMLNGVEAWNQHADGKQTPPLSMIWRLREMISIGELSLFFGCDIHDAKHKPSNILRIPHMAKLNVDDILNHLATGEFESRNLATGVHLSARISRDHLAAWLRLQTQTLTWKSKLYRGLRILLRTVFRQLPPGLRKRIDKLKTRIRNQL